MDSKSTINSPPSSRVYVLEEPGAGGAFRAQVDISTGDAFSLKRAERRLVHPIMASWTLGDPTPSDLIWTTSAVLVFASKRLVSRLEEAGIRGWITYQIRLRGKRGEVIDGYRGLAINGRCGPIDNERSVKVSKRYPAGDSPVWKGLYFEPATWDGSDMFMPRNHSGWVFVSARARSVFEDSGVTNVVCTDAEEIERSVL